VRGQQRGHLPGVHARPGRADAAVVAGASPLKPGAAQPRCCAAPVLLPAVVALWAQALAAVGTSAPPGRARRPRRAACFPYQFLKRIGVTGPVSSHEVHAGSEARACARQAQYFIPILGMLLGNAISGVSVGLSTLLEELASGARGPGLRSAPRRCSSALSAQPHPLPCLCHTQSKLRNSVL